DPAPRRDAADPRCRHGHSRAGGGARRQSGPPADPPRADAPAPRPPRRARILRPLVAARDGAAHLGAALETRVVALANRPVPRATVLSGAPRGRTVAHHVPRRPPRALDDRHGDDHGAARLAPRADRRLPRRG